MVQLVNIQFVKAKSLANSPNNPRISSQKYNNLRGTIYASDGTLLAQSVKATSGLYHYMRVYPQGPLYAGITGYDSLEYGTAGIEYQYNQYLQTHAQSPQNFSQLLFNKPPSEPDDITLTVDPVLQQAAQTALTTCCRLVRTLTVPSSCSTPPPGPSWPWSPAPPTTRTASPIRILPRKYRPRRRLRLPTGSNGQWPHPHRHPGERFPPGSSPKVVTEYGRLQPPSRRSGQLQRPSPSPILTFTDSRSDAERRQWGGAVWRLYHSGRCSPRRVTRATAGWGSAPAFLILTKQAQLFGYALYGTKDQILVPPHRSA